MILSDRSINEAIASGRLGIEPFDPKLVQPGLRGDVHIGSPFNSPANSRTFRWPRSSPRFAVPFLHPREVICELPTPRQGDQPEASRAAQVVGWRAGRPGAGMGGHRILQGVRYEIGVKRPGAAAAGPTGTLGPHRRAHSARYRLA